MTPLALDPTGGHLARRLLHHQSAIHGENLAGDVARFVRGEERDGVRDVLNRSKVPERSLGLDLIGQSGGQVLGQLGDDEARRDGVAGDAA